MADQSKLRIFLSYAREDRKTIARVYRRLRRAGFLPWMDTEDIRAGSRWEQVIFAAIKEAHVVLAMLSENSVNKRGVVQKEIRRALDLQLEKLDGDVYIVPVRIQQCRIPNDLAEFQSADLFRRNGWKNLLNSLHIQHAALFGGTPTHLTNRKQVKPAKVIEETDGRSYLILPGFIPSDDKAKEPTTFGVLSSHISGLSQRGLSASISEFFELVPKTIARPVYIFRGIRRPTPPEAAQIDNDILIYAYKPTKRETPRPTNSGMAAHGLPSNIVFVVLVKLQPLKDSHTSPINATIERWNWIEEDSSLKGAPTGWQQRYGPLIWRKTDS
jgi:hypothetical protein